MGGSGQYAKLKLTTSRRTALYSDDEIIAAFGARYAPDQFEGALPPVARPQRWVPTVLVAGAAMNVGKTTSVASLVHGLTTGLRVGACKLTGMGAGGDRHCYADAGRRRGARARGRNGVRGR